jgi:3-oxoadipate enol-lactonase
MSDGLFARQLGAGPPLLLIHGLMVTGEMFDPVLDDFAEHHRVIVPDLRGHGRSVRLAGPYTVAKLAEDLARLLDDLSLESADVLGYSQGGAVAQQFAWDYPDRTRHLVLVCTYAYNMLTLRERLEGALLPWLVKVLGPRRLAALFVRPGIRLGGGRPLTPEGARQLRGIITSNDRLLMVEAVRQMKAFDSREWLDQISCPTLVLCGSEDTAVPMHHARMLARGIRSSQLRVIEGAGHALLWTHPEEFVEQTELWLSSSEARQR